MPVTYVPAQVFPRIRCPSVAGSGSAAATTSRGATSTPRTRNGVVESSPSFCSVFNTSTNSSPSPYLKSTRRQSINRGISSTSSCSTFTHSTGPIPSGKSKTSGSEKGSVVYQPRSRSQITGGLRHSSIVVQIEKRGCEVVPLDLEVRAVTDPDRVDLGEELVPRVAGEDVGEARFNADPDEREQARLAPASVLGELGIAELFAGLGVRERHRQVEVGATRVEGRLEDRRIEAGVDRVQDRVHPLDARELCDRRGVGRVDDGSTQALVAVRLDRAASPGLVDIGEHHPLEEVATERHGGDRGSHSPCPHDQNAHPWRRYVR